MPILLEMQMSEDDRIFMMQLCDQYQEIIMRQVRRKMPTQECEDMFSAVMMRLIPRVQILRGLDEVALRAYIYSAT